MNLRLWWVLLLARPIPRKMHVSTVLAYSTHIWRCFLERWSIATFGRSGWFGSNVCQSILGHVAFHLSTHFFHLTILFHQNGTHTLHMGIEFGHLRVIRKEWENDTTRERPTLQNRMIWQRQDTYIPCVCNSRHRNGHSLEATLPRTESLVDPVRVESFLASFWTIWIWFDEGLLPPMPNDVWFRVHLPRLDLFESSRARDRLACELEGASLPTGRGLGPWRFRRRARDSKNRRRWDNDVKCGWMSEQSNSRQVPPSTFYVTIDFTWLDLP